MNKKALTEADIRTKFITPAIVGAGGSGWDVMTQVLEEHYFTRGRVIVRGKTTTRGEAKKADYILFYKPNIPLAVVEAKDNNYSVGAGMQQALEYAEILDVPFAYSSNGDAFLEHDRTATSGTVTREIPLDQFPTPEELWTRYRAAKGYTPEQETVATQEYYEDGSQKTPRYYQPSSSPSTARWTRSHVARIASSSSWPPARARLTPPSRLSGGCGSRRRRNAFSSSLIAISSPTRPRRTTSSRSARP
jgi:type I restriction enzyme R subunit